MSTGGGESYDGALEIRMQARRSRRTTVTVASLAALACLGSLFVAVLGSNPDAAVNAAGFGALAATSVLVVIWMSRVGRGRRLLMRLDQSGVTMPPLPTAPWSNLSEVRVSTLERSLVTRKPETQTRSVVFVPSSGIDLTGGSRRGRFAMRRYGSPLFVMTTWADVPEADILDGVRRFSDLPIRDE
ncbi:MAG: hypothetical protein ACRDYU_06835 [Actinomycetes bacterium]